MVFLSSEAVIVVTLKDSRDLPPVKNTFIHYHTPVAIAVQRFKTDPSSEKRSYDCSSSQVSTTSSGSSTPLPLEEDTQSSAGSSSPEDSDECVQRPDFTSTCTPTVCPLWSTAAPPQPSVKPVASRTPPSYEVLDDGSVRFSFTLRRAHNVTAWGLHVVWCPRGLLVNTVQRDGAVSHWNKQIKDGPSANRALLEGDIIVSLNKESYHGGCQAMLEESGKNLLRMVVLRRNAARADRHVIASAAEGSNVKSFLI